MLNDAKLSFSFYSCVACFKVIDAKTQRCQRCTQQNMGWRLVTEMDLQLDDNTATVKAHITNKTLIQKILNLDNR